MLGQPESHENTEGKAPEIAKTSYTGQTTPSLHQKKKRELGNSGKLARNAGGGFKTCLEQGTGVDPPGN